MGLYYGANDSSRRGDNPYKPGSSEHQGWDDSWKKKEREKFNKYISGENTNFNDRGGCYTTLLIMISTGLFAISAWIVFL